MHLPRRIGINTDMQILADIALRTMTNKEIAAKYGVSPSYVSKLSTGKKELDIHVPEPHKIMSEDFTAYEDDVDAVMAFIEQRKVLVSEEDVVKFLQQQITKSVVRIKIYSELIKKYKGE